MLSTAIPAPTPSPAAGPSSPGWPAAPAERPAVLAHEGAGDYDAGGSPEGPRDSVRRAARDLARAAERLVALAADGERAEGGELGALLATVAALDVGQAAATELAARAERAGSAERSAGLPVEGLLALSTRMPHPDRRMLLSAAGALRDLPHLRRAFQEGAVGWAEVRGVVCELRDLPADARARVDEGFADLEALGRRDADRLLGEVRAAAGELRPDREAQRTARAVEGRFLALQPMLDGGGGTGYFELDAEGFATVAAGLEGAMPPPSAGPRDVTRDAVGHADEEDPTDPAAAGVEEETPAGDPAFCDPVVRRSRARQRADGLVRLAETFLAGHRPDGTVRRARPRLQVVCEASDLARGATSQAARLLTRVVGARPALTAEAVRRLASDADVQLLVRDGGRIVGVSAPTPTIPARVRAAVQARDQGCRFPGCRAPAAFTDCHHVVPREDEGPTEVSNLVALCRRHHTAVTEGRWRLTMAEDGTVTVRRGRRTATSDPPGTTPFRSDPPGGPAPPRGPAPSRGPDPPPGPEPFPGPDPPSASDPSG